MMFSNVIYSLEADAKEREERVFLMFSDYIEEVQKGQLCICSFVVMVASLGGYCCFLLVLSLVFVLCRID